MEKEKERDLLLEVGEVNKRVAEREEQQRQSPAFQDGTQQIAGLHS